MSTLTISSALADARHRLASQSESYGLDAQVLMAHILEKDRAWILAHSEAILNDSLASAWEAALQRLEAGEALPFLLGEWEFFGLKLKVTPDVLIPRPETELLVEVAIVWIRQHPARRRAADVGTGSGCIPVAIAMHIPDAQLIAGDLTAATLEVARANVERYDLQERIQLVKSDLLQDIPGQFDVTTSNLPYIPSERLAELDVSKREPHIALDGGADGLRFIEPFLQQSAARLAPGGLVLAEIDASLESAVMELAKIHWPTAQIEVRKDLAGLPRLLVIQT
ncbi:MAG: peptide chain release factor N(5)-glutamine methyltransferase [Anaerolineales bacterium]